MQVDGVAYYGAERTPVVVVGKGIERLGMASARRTCIEEKGERQDERDATPLHALTLEPIHSVRCPVPCWPVVSVHGSTETEMRVSPTYLGELPVAPRRNVVIDLIF